MRCLACGVTHSGVIESGYSRLGLWLKGHASYGRKVPRKP